jgi:ribonuclease VapC
MIIDSSALIAILLQENEAKIFAQIIAQAKIKMMSVANWLEIQMVAIGRGGDSLALDIDVLVALNHIEIVPVTMKQGQGARHAFARYGKGIHPAGLNFGDCFAYALARDMRRPLLCKGKDFEQTDVERVGY